MLYGRGAVDMKGGIACFVAAALDYLAANGGRPKGSISLLITGDEESVAVNGTIKLLQWAAERGEKFDHCILGEPSNVEVARRHHQGRPPRLAQRHAGRHRPAGPRRLSRARRQSDPRPGDADRGTAERRSTKAASISTPSNLEFTSVDVGNPTVNLIPGEARARFNIRYNDRHSQASLKTLVEQPRRSRCRRARALRDRMAAVECRRLRHQAGPVHRSGGRRHRRGDRPQARSFRPAAAPRMRASSRTIARCWNSAWSARPCTRSTNARRLPI